MRIVNVRAGHWRYDGGMERSDFYLPSCDLCTGNTSFGTVNGAAEQAAVDAWDASRVAAGW